MENVQDSTLNPQNFKSEQCAVGRMTKLSWALTVTTKKSAMTGRQVDHTTQVTNKLNAFDQKKKHSQTLCI